MNLYKQLKQGNVAYIKVVATINEDDNKAKVVACGSTVREDNVIDCEFEYTIMDSTFEKIGCDIDFYAETMQKTIAKELDWKLDEVEIEYIDEKEEL